MIFFGRGDSRASRQVHIQSPKHLRVRGERLVLSLLASTILASCTPALFSFGAYDADARLVLTAFGSGAGVFMLLENDSDIPREVGEVQYELWVGDSGPHAGTAVPRKTVIEPGQEKRISFLVDIDERWLSKNQEFHSTKSTTYRIRGKAKLGSEEVPFETVGRLIYR